MSRTGRKKSSLDARVSTVFSAFISSLIAPHTLQKGLWESNVASSVISSVNNSSFFYLAYVLLVRAHTARPRVKSMWCAGIHHMTTRNDSKLLYNHCELREDNYQ